MDSSLNPISFNAEAIQILGYPDKMGKPKRTEIFLAEKIRSTLLTGRPLGSVPFVTEFRSAGDTIFAGPSLWMRTPMTPLTPA